MNGFLALSYHYIRPPKEADLFPRILGTGINDFVEHLKAFAPHYYFVSPEEVMEFYRHGKEIRTQGIFLER